MLVRFALFLSFFIMSSFFGGAHAAEDESGAQQGSSVRFQEERNSQINLSPEEIELELAPLPHFKDERMNNVAPSIRKHIARLIAYERDSLTFSQHVRQEAYGENPRPLHEITDLFLRGTQLKRIELWLKTSSVTHPGNIDAFFDQYKKMLSLRDNPAALECFIRTMLDMEISYLEIRISNNWDVNNYPMTFSDTIKTYGSLDKRVIEETNNRFAGHVLILRDLFSQKYSEKTLLDNHMKFLKTYTELAGFINRTEHIIKDVDSYIEPHEKVLGLLHGARKGNTANSLAKRFLDQGTNLTFIFETSQSPIKANKQIKAYRQKLNNDEHKKNKNMAQTMVDMQHRKIKSLNDETIKHERLLRDEKRQLLRDEKRQLEANKRQAAAASAAVEPGVMVGTSGSVKESALQSADEPTKLEQSSEPTPKVKVKSRGMPQPAGAAAAEEKGEEEVASYTVYRVNSRIWDLHQSVMGPYHAKLSWEKVEKLAQYFGVTITGEDHGGDHRVLHYQDCLGVKTSTTLAIREHYGRGTFNGIRKFFIECRLDKTHVVSE
ncbi:MAG: hypothetical protein WCG04_06800 [Alphaproteobacteria bacterium]